MQEVCYCGRVGELEDRVAVLEGEGERALRCPNEACGHLEHLEWLPEEARRAIFERAELGRPRIAA